MHTVVETTLVPGFATASHSWSSDLVEVRLLSWLDWLQVSEKMMVVAASILVDAYWLRCDLWELCSKAFLKVKH